MTTITRLPTALPVIVDSSPPLPKSAEKPSQVPVSVHDGMEEGPPQARRDVTASGPPPDLSDTESKSAFRAELARIALPEVSGPPGGKFEIEPPASFPDHGLRFSIGVNITVNENGVSGSVTADDGNGNSTGVSGSAGSNGASANATATTSNGSSGSVSGEATSDGTVSGGGSVTIAGATVSGSASTNGDVAVSLDANGFHAGAKTNLNDEARRVQNAVLDAVSFDRSVNVTIASPTGDQVSGHVGAKLDRNGLVLDASASASTAVASASADVASKNGGFPGGGVTVSAGGVTVSVRDDENGASQSVSGFGHRVSHEAKTDPTHFLQRVSVDDKSVTIEVDAKKEAEKQLDWLKKLLSHPIAKKRFA